MIPPDLVAHADWSVAPGKRWLALARRQPDGRFRCESPVPAGDPATLLARLRAEAGPRAAIAVGFDFPIGLPLAYARAAGVRDYLATLPAFGAGEWQDFYRVAADPQEISLKRPFYPARPGRARQHHLLRGLGMSSIDDLRRRCELGHAHRRPAAPLFWTLGGQQVGKAAITGWRDVLGPALRNAPEPVRIWPFSGRLDELLQPGATLIAETYPGEFYHHLGIRFASPERGASTERKAASSGPKSGKRAQISRAANATAMLGWGREAGVRLSPALRQAIEAGFGPAPGGEDPFDAVAGLLGMLNVLLGRRPAGEPPEGDQSRIEGWILGQHFGAPEYPV